VNEDLDRAAAALVRHAERMRDCRICRLCEGRTQVVFGVGSPVADLMFVGEGPGFHEDRLGEPFVGQAGKLLNELLGTISLSREDVYIANVVKCRPPENRDPLPDEIAACSPNLMEQIGVIRPRVICTLGRFATRLIAQTDASISAIRGRAKPMELAGISVLVLPVFHPAAALYTPANKETLQQDFYRLRRLLEKGDEALATEARAAGDSRGDLDPEGPAETASDAAGADERESGQAAARSGAAPLREPDPEQLQLW
jgi:uracil-DNA glycosylase family 4